MTVVAQSKHQLAVEALARRESPQHVREAVRFIKNVIIGNPTKKDHYLHSLDLAPRMVECLRVFGAETELCMEIATVVASLANGCDQNVATLVAAGIMPPLFSALSSPDPRLVDAGVRALRSIVQRPALPGEQVFELAHIQGLTALVADAAENPSSISIHIAEVTAIILARIAESSTAARDAVAVGGTISSLVKWLDPRWSSTPRVQEAVLDCLASLSLDNTRVARSISMSKLPDGQRVVNAAFSLVRDKRPSMRLAAASCITNMHRAMAIPRELQPSIVLVLLPTVIRLFSDAAQQASAGSAGYPGLATISERAMALFATLVADNQELQTAAMEADAIVKLAQIITGLAAAEATAEQGSKSAKQAKQHGVSWDMPRSPDAFAGLAVSAAAAVDRQRESALQAVADVCGLKEECRKQVIDAKLLPHIVASLSHHSTGVRKAACRCTRSLSRSVKNLRTSLMDAGIAAPLFNLLFDTSIDVQIEASATLCNIVLDFSPMKKIVLEKGGVKRLVELVAQPNILLRRNALWALKNMTFQNDSEIKRDVMQHLGWDKLLVLMDDGDLVIQEQALNLLRNLACGKESATLVQDVDAVFSGFRDADIFGVLERKLQTMAAHPEIVLQTLYIIVNLGIGNLEHKTAMMARTGLLQHTFAFLDHENPQIRVAAIWCVINLTWMDDPGARERVIALSALGIEEKLRRLVNDDNLDVKDRAATALSNMQGSLSAAGGSSSTAQPTSATGQTAPTVGDSSPAAQHDSSDTML